MRAMNLARNGQGIQLEGPGMGRNLHSIPQIQTEIYEKTNGGKKWDRETIIQELYLVTSLFITLN